MGKLGGIMPSHTSEPTPRWVTARQVAERYRVTVPTVFNWLRAGIIPAKVAVGRVYRFDLEQVDAALSQRSARESQSAEDPSKSGCGSAARHLTQSKSESAE